MKKIILLFFLVPLFANAAIGSVQDLISAIAKLVASILPVLFAVALLVFFYGIAETVRKSDSDEARLKGRNLMFWGIVALFVMSSIWGIVAFLQSDILGIRATGNSDVLLSDERDDDVPYSEEYLFEGDQYVDGDE